MKIDLHCNLPYNPATPNAAIGYLKGFLTKNKIQVRNIYWNLVLFNILAKQFDLIDRYQKLNFYNPLNYISLYLAKHLYKENSSQNTSYIARIVESNVPKIELDNLGQELQEYIDKYIEQNKLYDVELAGFSAKYAQWLLNYYILLRLKHYNPDIKTIIGGANTSSEGQEFLRIFDKVDFVIWGEGEIPLLRLLENIDNPKSFNKIPNLIYRGKNKIELTNSTLPIDLPDVNSYPFANHEDYFPLIKKYKFNWAFIDIPIWGIRSCSWNRCKFCVLNEGYTYRERTPENIVQEIEYQSKKYDNDHFIFMDNDIGRKDRKEFDQLLSLLIKSSKNRKNLYHISGDISPLRIDRESIKAMEKISIDFVQIGFEATSDSLLKKMNKKHRFIHNLQTLKLAEEQDLSLKGVNIIKGVPSETEEEVIESITNLKFLRFLLVKYPLNTIPMYLYKGAPFYEEMDENKRKTWDFNLEWSSVKNLDFLSNANRFEFFGFEKKHENSHLWQIFKGFLDKYQSNNFSYSWIEHADGSSEIQEIGKYNLNKTETEILKFCDTIKTKTEIQNKFSKIKENELQELLFSLRDVGLLYIDDNFNQALTVLSTRYLKIAK